MSTRRVLAWFSPMFALDGLAAVAYYAGHHAVAGVLWCTAIALAPVAVWLIEKRKSTTR